MDLIQNKLEEINKEIILLTKQLGTNMVSIRSYQYLVKLLQKENKTMRKQITKGKKMIEEYKEL